MSQFPPDVKECATHCRSFPWWRKWFHSPPKPPLTPSLLLVRGGLAFANIRIFRGRCRATPMRNGHELALPSGHNESGVPPREPPSKVCLVRQRCYAGSCPETRQPDCHQPLLRRSEVRVAISEDVREHGGSRVRRQSHITAKKTKSARTPVRVMGAPVYCAHSSLC